MDDQNIAVRATPFLNHIPPCDAKVNTAITHADCDIPGALEEHRQTRQARDGGAILAGIGFVNMQPDFCKQLKRLFGKIGI